MLILKRYFIFLLKFEIINTKICIKIGWLVQNLLFPKDFRRKIL